MAFLGDLSARKFYLHLPVIHKLGVLIPFSPFEVGFLSTSHVVAPKSHSTSRSLLGPLRSYASIWAYSPPLGYSFRLPM